MRGSERAARRASEVLATLHARSRARKARVNPVLRGLRCVDSITTWLRRSEAAQGPRGAFLGSSTHSCAPDLRSGVPIRELALPRVARSGGHRWIGHAASFGTGVVLVNAERCDARAQCVACHAQCARGACAVAAVLAERRENAVAFGGAAPEERVSGSGDVAIDV